MKAGQMAGGIIVADIFIKWQRKEGRQEKIETGNEGWTVGRRDYSSRYFHKMAEKGGQTGEDRDRQ
jgi:hypothetical protein